MSTGTRSFAFEGQGINRKTGKRIDFEVPSSLSMLGIEGIVKNVEVTSLINLYTLEPVARDRLAIPDGEAIPPWIISLVKEDKYAGLENYVRRSGEYLILI